jgi:AraC-like DNA-binding protein
MINPDLQVVPGGVEGFQAAICETYFPYEISATKGADSLFSAVATGHVGPLRMTRIQVSAPFQGRRRISARDDERKTFVLMLIEDGQVRFRGRRSDAAEAGNLVLINSDQPLETEQRACGTSMAVSVPSSLLMSRFPEADDWCLRALDATAGSPAVLRECMLAYWRARANLRTAEAIGLAESMVQLIGVAFRSQNSLPLFLSHSTQMHFLRVRDVVLENLDNPALSVEFVSDQLSISKSYLFTIMNAADTTLGRFILEQRLERARELLADMGMMVRSISDIALSVGFPHLSHFSRRFTERYGKSPRAFRVEALALAAR